MTAETAAEGLDALYVDELRQSLLPPVHPMVNRRQTEALIGRARTAEPAACTEPDAATWIWSDLHLGHEHSRSAFGRPFRTAAADDEAMMEAWYEQVAEGETIICLGDVTVDGEALAHHQEWWRKAPGAKWLVLGNHDCRTTTEVALTADLSVDLQGAWEWLRETAAAVGDQRIYASHKSIMFARESCYFFVRSPSVRPP